MKVSKAEFFRWLTIGKRIRLTNCLVGPCDKPRIVKKVSGMRAEFTTEQDTVSHLSISPEQHIEKTPTGYRIVLTADNRICAEYSE